MLCDTLPRQQSCDAFAVQPFKRENKRTKARDAARAAHPMQAEAAGSTAADATGQAGGGGAAAGQPQAGDVVEYPLSKLRLQLHLLPDT